MISAALLATDTELHFGLQNRCTTAVLIRRRGGFPSFLRVCGQRETRRKREEDRFASSRKAAQSVSDSPLHLRPDRRPAIEPRHQTVGGSNG